MTDELVTAECRRSHSGFILEYQQLYNRYTFCLASLQESIKEVDALRQENESLRLANADLAQRLSLLSQATIENCLLSDFNRLSIGRASPSSSRVTTPNITSNPPDFIQHNRLERRPLSERVSLPKSISIRSTGYLQVKPHSGGKSRDPMSKISSQDRVNSPPLPESDKTTSQRVYVAGEGSDGEALHELDVYNQGMSKTELCNKWQETGSCPYGENCQFAHGIKELRPVIRHPRYKTEVCRMVLSGAICPYGHRCHFRHSLAHIS